MSWGSGTARSSRRSGSLGPAVRRRPLLKPAPATPSGWTRRVKISAIPPTSSAQLPEIPNHRSKACGSTASVEISPAKTAPETLVTPPM